AGLTTDDTTLVTRALDWSRPRFRVREVGEQPEAHAAALVCILAGLRADAPTRAAALVAYALDDEPETIAQRSHKDALSAALGADVARLARGYRALTRVGMVTREAGEALGVVDTPQAERLRKMLLAMAADLRIVLMR